MNKALLTSVILLGCLGSYQALAGSIAAELEPSEGSISDTFMLSIAVQGSMEGRPRLPEVDGLVFTNTSHNQSIKMINGQTTVELVLGYAINPQKSGVFTIPSITAKVDGQEVSTVPLQLKVLPAGSKPAAPSTAGKDKGDKSQAANTGGVFIERQCTTLTPYVGEQVLCAIRIHHRDDLVGGQPQSQASADMRRFAIEGEKQYARAIEGKRFSVIEVREVLIPQKAGEVVAPEYTLQARVLVRTRHNNPLDKLFGGFNFDLNFREQREVQIPSEAPKMQVKPLPEQGKPAEFRGLVGQYQLAAQVSKAEVAVGDTVTITITVQGHGVLDTMPELKPALEQLGKIYADKPEYKEQLDAEKGISSSKTFKYALVPKNPGNFNLGRLTLPYFDTASGGYQTLQADLGNLLVTPAKVEEKTVMIGTPAATPASNKQDVQLLGQNFIGPHRSLAATSDALTTADLPMLVALGGGPMSLGLCMWGLGLLKKRRQRDPYEQRRSRAAKTWQEAVRQATRQVAEAPGPALIAGARAFRAFISDKRGLPGGVLAARDLERELKQLKLPEPLLQQASTLMQRCEQVEYGQGAPNPETAQRWLAELDNLAKEIDRRA